MPKLIDAVAGELDYEYGWCRTVSVEFLGKTRSIQLAFSGEEDRELDEGQREAFSAFWSSKERLLSDAEAAIFEHYQSIRPDVLARVSADVREEMAPPVERTEDLDRVVRLETLFFPDDFGSGKRVAGLLADCSWDPALGLAVRFEDERVVEVGPQDIVL
ncbi:hypothetical protein [Dokdonella sp.]|uniref:DUF6985 domain-containing protein n=1 Tax=Dokdonella sp. TaxID=2291710 RepID=UPI001B10444B|nr:hypothetical protein [Dokdonella sp.]MBO9664192.1 hypothetical protein [Dokdonella sp.]